MIRILHCVNDMHRAGLETMLMNYYRNINREEVQFDFLTHRPYRSDYDDEIESLGGKVYYAPRLYPHNYLVYFRWMDSFFKQHPEYQIVHSHIDTMSYLPLLAAKNAGIPVRIAHSHNTSIDKDFKYLMKKHFRNKINSVVTDRLACGEEAGRFLFGENYEFKVIPNAVDSRNFYFNQKVREKKRKELELSDEFVVGHVGRITYQKNHKYLLEIFNELVKKEPNAVLLLIGVGEKEDEIRNQARQLGLTSRVKFLGNRNDVFELYQVMDVFLLPSFFEGIPVVGIEAQFADLPCIFSDKVPMEVKFTSKVNFIPLSNSCTEWVDTILKYRHSGRITGIDEFTDNKYDIVDAHEMLEKYYIDKLAEIGGKNAII